MKLFLTPNATFTTGLRWSDSLEKFVPCDVKGSDYVFEIATPTRAELHEHYGAFMGVPARGGSGLDYSELDEQIWGTENKPGLVRKVLPDIKGKGIPHPALTLSIARIVREQLGMEPPLVEPPTATAPTAGIDSEGNSASPSESGSAS